MLIIDKRGAKQRLDKLISKSRVHLYKPIQIAEILYHQRVIEQDLDLLDLESYRVKSKEWRDKITIELVGSKSISSAKYQDNLFDENAIPPSVLKVLGEENIRTNGGVEAYIYDQFDKKHSQLNHALEYCISVSPEEFNVSYLINSFWKTSGLRRSLDKIYEIIVYALFEILVTELELTVDISVSEEKLPLLDEFEDFAKKVMCLDSQKLINSNKAHVYRVGVTNAADRGLDMYSNWGPAIQIKHITLNEDMAEDIVESIGSDRVVIVCKQAESKIIVSLLNQIGWPSRIQSIITEDDIILWYDKALHGIYGKQMSKRLLDTICEQIELEFPSLNHDVNHTITKRNYSTVHDDFWK